MRYGWTHHMWSRGHVPRPPTGAVMRNWAVGPHNNIIQVPHAAAHSTGASTAHWG